MGLAHVKATLAHVFRAEDSKFRFSKEALPRPPRWPLCGCAASSRFVSFLVSLWHAQKTT